MDNPEHKEYLESDFFQNCYEKFCKASQITGIVSYFIDIDSISVCLEFAGKNMFPIIVPPLEHLKIIPVKTPAFKICIWDSESASINMVPPPGKISDFTLSGELPGFKSKNFKTAFQWNDFSLSMMDMQSGVGIFWVNKKEHLSSDFYASPLHIIFQWILEKHGRLLIHASAICIDQTAILIVGKDKSAVLSKCLESNLTYFGDEFVIANLYPKPYVFRLYNTLKLPNEILEKFPAVTDIAINKRKKINENVTLFFCLQLKNIVAKQLALKSILLADFENHKVDILERMPPWKAQKTIGFDTITQFPNTTVSMLDFIEKLFKDLPCFSIGKEYNSLNITNLNTSLITNPKIYTSDKTHVKDNYPNTSCDLISIIIPVYNGAEFIKDTINNIASQNYPSVEIIIVNDGSTDNTEEIVRQLNSDIIYLKQDNLGPASARNLGIKTASGDYITFLDVDDLWPENNLNFLVDEMNKNPALDIVLCYAQIMEKDMYDENFQPVGNPKASYPYYIGSGMYRKTAFSKVGFFDSTLGFSEDTDWFKRAIDQHLNIKRIDAVSLIVRRHGGNITIGKDAFGLKLFDVLKKNIERKRHYIESH